MTYLTVCDSRAVVRDEIASRKVDSAAQASKRGIVDDSVICQNFEIATVVWNSAGLPPHHHSLEFGNQLARQAISFAIFV